MNPSRIALRGVLLAAWLSATGAIGTCDYFKPATPEPPSRPPIIADYSTPTRALETLAKGVEDKGTSNGQDVYLGAFAESTLTGGDGRAFHGFFDPVDIRDDNNWNPALNDWTRDLERQFYPVLVRQYTYPYEMTWAPYEPAGNEIGSDTDSLLHRKYRVMYLLPDGTRSPVVAGAADLTFVRSRSASNRWVIAQWQDYHTLDADSAQVTLGKRRLETQ